MTPRHIELLAPARTADIARAAIDCGADAIYIGADRFGARAAAANTVDEIARLCDYAHRFRVRIYATLNTIIYEDELRQAELLAKRLWKAGVDALIVQDMAMLRLDLPPIALHASTQCDIRTVEKARFPGLTRIQSAGAPARVDPRRDKRDTRCGAGHST